MLFLTESCLFYFTFYSENGSTFVPMSSALSEIESEKIRPASTDQFIL